MVDVDRYRSVRRSYTSLKRRVKQAGPGNVPGTLVDEASGLVDVLGQVSHIERFVVTQSSWTVMAGGDADDRVTGSEYGARLEAAFETFAGSRQQRFSRVRSVDAWDSFRTDEVRLLTENGFRFTEAVDIVRSVRPVPDCVAFLAPITSVRPGRGFAEAFTSVKNVLAARPVLSAVMLAVITRLDKLNRLQMVLDVDGDAAEAGIDFPLAELSGLLADISTHTLGQIDV